MTSIYYGGLRGCAYGRYIDTNIVYCVRLFVKASPKAQQEVRKGNDTLSRALTEAKAGRLTIKAAARLDSLRQGQ